MRKKHLCNITKFFLTNKYLNKYIKKKANEKFTSLDKFAHVFKKYFLTHVSRSNDDSMKLFKTHLFDNSLVKTY